MSFTCKGKGYLIALDSKARLVLPLEIRDALGVKKNGKILLTVSAAQGGTMAIKLRKASDSDDGIAYSRNGKYVEKQK